MVSYCTKGQATLAIKAIAAYFFLGIWNVLFALSGGGAYWYEVLAHDVVLMRERAFGV